MAVFVIRGVEATRVDGIRDQIAEQIVETVGVKVARVERFLELVSETEAAGDFPARPGILCAWCGFNAVCPAADVPDRFAGGLRYAQGTG